VIRPDQLQFTTEQKNNRWTARCNQLPDLRATGRTRIDALDDIMRQAFYRLREIDRQGYEEPRAR
jgi:hypothetical protein